MRQSKVRAPTCNTRATKLRPHLRCDTWDVRKFVFTRRNLVNFFVENPHFFFFLLTICFKFSVFCHRSDRQNALQHSLLPSSTCRVAMWKFGPGVVVFVVRPDQEEIGIIVALEIGVQLGIKEESERFVVFKGWIYFSKRCRTLGLKVSWTQ